MKYREINSEFYCGVDIHSKRSYICVLDNTGKKYLNRSMVNNFQDFKELLRTNFFPEAYPYLREMRPTRDLLRRRHRLVSIRAEAYSHIQMVAHQNGIQGIGSAEVKDKSFRDEMIKLFDVHQVTPLITAGLEVIDLFTPVIEKMEKEVQQNAVHHNPKDVLLCQTTLGIGDMLSLIMVYESHDIKRLILQQKI